MKLLFAFILSFALGFVLTPVARFFAIKYNVLDIPRDLRRVHSDPTPLLGGVAVYIAVLITALIFLKFDFSIAGIFLGGGLIMVVGVFDDKYDLSAKLKFIFQIASAVIAYVFGVRIDFLTNPFGSNMIVLMDIVSFLLTVFWIVGITNAINIIDGLDGLSSGISTISLLTFAFISYKVGRIDMSTLSLIGAGAALGFLPYNYHPASIFLGDAGALFLGFLIACISIEGLIKSTAFVTLAIPVLGISVPIFDTLFAIVRRLRNGKKIYVADKGHLHHRLLEKGYGQRKTVLILYVVSAIYSFIAILMTELSSRNALFLALAVIVVTLIVANNLKLFSLKEE